MEIRKYPYLIISIGHFFVVSNQVMFFVHSMQSWLVGVQTSRLITRLRINLGSLYLSPLYKASDTLAKTR